MECDEYREMTTWGICKNCSYAGYDGNPQPGCIDRNDGSILELSEMGVVVVLAALPECVPDYDEFMGVLSDINSHPRKDRAGKWVLWNVSLSPRAVATVHTSVKRRLDADGFDDGREFEEVMRSVECMMSFYGGIMYGGVGNIREELDIPEPTAPYVRL